MHEHSTPLHRNFSPPVSFSLTCSFLDPPPLLTSRPRSVSHASFTWSPARSETFSPGVPVLPPHCSSSPPHIGPTMAFRKALKRTAILGGGAVATVYGLSQLIEYRKKQVSWRQMLFVHQMLFSCKTYSFAAFHSLAAGKIQGQTLNPSVFWVWQQSNFQIVCFALKTVCQTGRFLYCLDYGMCSVSSSRCLFFIECFSAAVLQASAHSQRKEDKMKTFPFYQQDFYLHVFSSTSCSINCVLFINCTQGSVRRCLFYWSVCFQCCKVLCTATFWEICLYTFFCWEVE